jgi:hypothetical protein
MRDAVDACARSVVLAVLGMVACDPEPRPRELRVHYPVPAPDVRGACADVLDFRVCWDAECPSGTCVVERSVPSAPAASPLGWRCVGGGEERSCSDRGHGVGRFACQRDSCVQVHPRLPDDGEWTCAEMAGAVLCVGGDGPAGTPPGPRDAGFLCGKRRPTPGPSRFDARAGAAGLGQGATVCLDLSPDFPDSSPRGWVCRYEHEHGMRRICERRETQGALGAACSSSAPCIDGLLCAAGRCVPRRPEPSCWLDADCASASCRLASCVQESH